MAKEMYRIPRLDGGLATNVSPLLLDIQEGYCQEFMNMEITSIGTIDKRPGLAPVLESTEKPIQGLYEYVKTTTGDIYKLIISNGVLYSWDEDGEEWDEIESGLDKDAFFDFKTIADKVAIVNGEDKSLLWDGSSTSKPGDFPKGKFLEEFRLRLVCAGDTNKPSTIYLSDPGDPSLWDPQAGGSAALEEQVSPNDGEGITGLLNIGDNGLLIGKPSALYRLFGYTSKDFAIDLIDSSVGSASHKAMKYLLPYVYFVNKTGIYRMQGVQPPELISLPIQDRFEAEVDKLNLEDSRAILYNRQYIITLPKKEGGYLTFVFHIDHMKWSEWDTHMGEYTKVSNDEDGSIYLIEPGGTQVYRLTPGSPIDDGGLISTELITAKIDAEVPEVEKDFSDLYVIMRAKEQPYEVVVSYQTDRNPDWVQVTPVMVSNKIYPTVIRVPLGFTARFMRVRLKSTAVGNDFSPLGMTFILEKKGVL